MPPVRLAYIKRFHLYHFHTEKGRAIAEKIYERHQVLTEILMALGVDRETAAADACKMEHDISDKTFDAMKRHLQTKQNGNE